MIDWKKMFRWFADRPVVSVIFGILALFGYANVFVFGFLQSVPTALRPFLDGVFFSSLALEFFMSIAVSAVCARVFVLVVRLVLVRLPIKPSSFFEAMNLPGLFEDIFERVFDIDRLVSVLDRQAIVRAKLAARWIRRRRIFVTVGVGILFFSVIFLGWHNSIWFLPMCLVLLPLVWAVVSRVELHRSFATVKNTQSISSHRLTNALVSFALIYVGAITLLAGVAAFDRRLDSEVSIGASSSARTTSLIAVTGSGVLVGDRDHETAWPNRIFTVSAHFIPFDGVASIGQKNWLRK